MGRDRFSPIRPLAFGGEIAQPLSESLAAGILPPAPVAAAKEP